MGKNKRAEKERVVEMPPFVKVSEGKVLIEIEGETKAFEPTYLGGENAAIFLSTANVRDTGCQCSSTLDFAREYGVKGVNVREWLGVAIQRSAVIRGLREQGIRFAAPTGEMAG